ncbi:MAG: hypothetical protein ACHQAX_06945 [Gammaproteobacteria bacterium]
MKIVNPLLSAVVLASLSVGVANADGCLNASLKNIQSTFTSPVHRPGFTPQQILVFSISAIDSDSDTCYVITAGIQSGRVVNVPTTSSNCNKVIPPAGFKMNYTSNAGISSCSIIKSN